MHARRRILSRPSRSGRALVGCMYCTDDVKSFGPAGRAGACLTVLALAIKNIPGDGSVKGGPAKLLRASLHLPSHPRRVQSVRRRFPPARGCCTGRIPPSPPGTLSVGPSVGLRGISFIELHADRDEEVINLPSASLTLPTAFSSLSPSPPASLPHQPPRRLSLHPLPLQFVQRLHLRFFGSVILHVETTFPPCIRQTLARTQLLPRLAPNPGHSQLSRCL